MLSFFKGKKKNSQQSIVLFAPVDGQIINLSEVPDQVFASKMMGEGVAFDFSGDSIVSPCDAKVMLVAHTLHAVGLVAENGAEILIHVGLDTTELNGKGFKVFVSEGQRVMKGEKLLSFNRKSIEEYGYNLITPMVITNSGEFNLEVISDFETVEKTVSPVVKFKDK
ncbi:TPA: PTS glucose transporter subunit IIA [Enterococcus faecium]|nr:PTS glucose transporter subunit IIA [Enterococcus faecium]